jgi:hypothetical protein
MFRYRNLVLIGFTAAALLINFNFNSNFSFSRSCEAQQTRTAREQSAAEIISACHANEIQANKLIAQTQKDTADAVRLNGTANRYESKLAPMMKPLTGAKLAAAKKMYHSDLEQFVEHARSYRSHNQSVRHTYGECAASRAAYEKNKNSYLLHGKEFHMEDVPPPHICATMQMAMNGADGAQSNLKDNMKRMFAAQVELMKTEARLNAALQNSTAVDADVRKQHALNLQEQDLAAEFARLQEEYRQLSVEKQALSRGGVKTPVSSVHAKIRH